MRKLLLVATGAGIGYVLGARAGRPAYDRIVEGSRRLGEAAGLDRTRRATREVVSEARHAGEQLRDRADTRLAETVDKVGSVLPPSEADLPDGADADATTAVPDPTAETRATDMANGY